MILRCTDISVKIYCDFTIIYEICELISDDFPAVKILWLYWGSNFSSIDMKKKSYETKKYKVKSDIFDPLDYKFQKRIRHLTFLS